MVRVSTCNAITHHPHLHLHNPWIEFQSKHVNQDYCNNPYSPSSIQEIQSVFHIWLETGGVAGCPPLMKNHYTNP